MGWFDNVRNPKIKNAKKPQSNTPTGLWKKCVNCGEILQSTRLEQNLSVCPFCDHHYRLSAEERIQVLTDEGSFREFGAELETSNPLNFEDKYTYNERLNKAYKTTGKKDGTVCGYAKVNSIPVVLAVMDFSFMGGSMGVVTGEKIAMAMDEAYEKKVPCIVVSCSGGARMQEGILSLMQMGKTSASRHRLRNARIPYISILTDPTTGGCAASFSMLGDINMAEPHALIGFAGPRVIEQSIRQTLPKGFQRSEFLKDHGFVDTIVHRKKLKDELAFYLKMFTVQ